MGGGTPVGMLAEMLAAGLNANLGGRDQIPIEVERQVLRWVCELFGFPENASGLFVTGTSMATLIAVLVARHAALGPMVRAQGIAASGKRLTAYTSTGAHGSIVKMMDLAGLGTDALHAIPVNAHYEMDILHWNKPSTRIAHKATHPFSSPPLQARSIPARSIRWVQ